VPILRRTEPEAFKPGSSLGEPQWRKAEGCDPPFSERRTRRSERWPASDFSDVAHRRVAAHGLVFVSRPQLAEADRGSKRLSEMRARSTSIFALVMAACADLLDHPNLVRLEPMRGRVCNGVCEQHRLDSVERVVGDCCKICADGEGRLMTHATAGGARRSATLNDAAGGAAARMQMRPRRKRCGTYLWWRTGDQDEVSAQTQGRCSSRPVGASLSDG
jgi:hypothetical protein